MEEPSRLLLGSIISVFTWISKYITWISKQQPHFYAFYWFFMCWFLLFIECSTLQQLSWKVTFSSTQKPTPPTVFNLQASNWVHCEEETGAYYQLSLLTYKFSFFLQVAYFAPPKYAIFKKFLKIYYCFFIKKRR